MGSPFFRRPHPAGTTEKDASRRPSSPLQSASRERVFDVLSKVLLALAVPLLIANTRVALFITHRYSLSILYLVAFLFLALIAFGKQWFPYSWRIWGLLLLVWGVGITAYTGAGGVGGDGRIWLMLAIVLAALLLDGWQVVTAVLLSLSLHFVMAWLILKGILPYPTNEVSSHNPLSWYNTGLTLAAVGVVLSGVLFSLRRGLEAALEESQQLTGILEQERQRLEQQRRLLQRRLAQLRTASEISRAASTVLEEQELLEKVVNLIQERFGLYYVGIFLLDERGEYAVLKAGSGEAGRKMLAAGHRLAVGGTSMVGWAIANRQARIALDVGEDAVRFANPYLPLTRSELAIPLMAHGEVLGAMTVQSEQPEAFSQDDLLVLQGIADAIAIALSNARLFRTTQETLRELESIHAQTLTQAWSDLPASGLQVSVGEEAEEDDGRSKHLLRLPLIVRNQQVGEAILEREIPWEEEEKALAQALLTQAGLALDSASLLTESLRRATQEQVLGEISAHLGATLDMDQMLRTLLNEMQQVLNIQEAEIHLVTPASVAPSEE